MNLNDPNLDFAGQAEIIANALRQANQDEETPLPVGRFSPQGWAVTPNVMGTILNRAAGQLQRGLAERDQTALNQEQLKRFDAYAKSLATPGTKPGKVLAKTLAEGQQGPEPEIDGQVPLSPEEENQRQLGVALQMSKLPMAKAAAQPFITSGANFPEKMAQIRSQQESQLENEATKAQSRLQGIQMRLADRALDRQSRETLQRESMALRREIASMAAANRGGAKGTDTTPEEDAALQKAIAENRLDPRNINSRNRSLLAHTALTNPGYDFNAAHANAVLQSNPAQQSRSIALEQLPEVIDNVVKAGSKLKFNKYFSPIAKGQETYKKLTKDPDYTNYMTQRNDAMMTITGIMRQVGMSDKSIELEIKSLPEDASPDQFKAWAEGQMAALKPRLDSARAIRGNAPGDYKAGSANAGAGKVKVYNPATGKLE